MMQTLPESDPASAGFTVRSVSEVSRLIASLLDDERLHEIWIEGEITNYKAHPKGHRYFSLSESRGQTGWTITCAMWRSYAAELGFEPQNGQKILAWGSVEVYEPHGKYQFIVREMVRAGAGEKHLLVQHWKQQLEDEGLFDIARKRPLPRFPERVGVVTAESGAARHDIETVIGRRWPCEIIFSPALVQGDEAPVSIVQAIASLDGKTDVIIVGRGGGSFEDLFAFNNPAVVRAIAGCRTPVVSAVGHETDVTLSDFAADMRAATPSAAAELVVPDRVALRKELASLGEGLTSSLFRATERMERQCEDFRLRMAPRRLVKKLNDETQRLIDLDSRLGRYLENLLENRRMAVQSMKNALNAVSPLAPLERGFAVIRTGAGTIRSVDDVSVGEGVSIFLCDGSLIGIIKEVRHGRDI